jgi:hypothetical protein
MALEFVLGLQRINSLTVKLTNAYFLLPPGDFGKYQPLLYFKTMSEMVLRVTKIFYAPCGSFLIKINANEWHPRFS